MKYQLLIVVLLGHALGTAGAGANNISGRSPGRLSLRPG